MTPVRRRHAAVAAVVVLVALGVAYGEASDSDDAAPAPTAASTPASRVLEAMNAYLEHDEDYIALVAAPPWGGRVFCATHLDSTSRDGDTIYAYASCAQVYVDDARLTIGSAGAGPVAFTAVHHTTKAGDPVVDRITDVGWPRDRTRDADYRRLFPADVRRRLPTGGYEKTPTELDLFARARPAWEAGRLGPGTPEAIAAAFLDFARGQRDTVPADTPVRLYLGNSYVRTVAAADVDERSAWQLCQASYAERDCPIDPLDVFDEHGLMPRITTDPLPPRCLQRLADGGPRGTGASRSVALVPYMAPRCAWQYAVQLWVNDVGQITAVNLLLGRP